MFGDTFSSRGAGIEGGTLEDTEEEADSTTFGALGAGAAATVFFTGDSDKATGVST